MGSPEVLYGDTLSRLASKFNLEMVAFDARRFEFKPRPAYAIMTAGIYAF